MVTSAASDKGCESVRKVICIKDGRFRVKPDFKKEGIVLHPIPAACADRIFEGEEWEGFYRAVHATGKVDKGEKPVYVQVFVPRKKVRDVKITLPQRTGRTPIEYALSQAVAIVKSGRRELKRLLIEPIVLFEPYTEQIMARLCYVYRDVVRVGCPKRLSLDDARAIGCPPEVLSRVPQ